jgi:membrane fusion protein (multidrug efflux system)
MKKIWPWIIVALVVALLVIFKPHNDAAPVDSKQPQKIKAVLVDVRIVHSQPIVSSITTSGSILSNEEVIIQSQTAGIVSKIYFSEGSKVKKGDLLIKIDDSQLQAQLQKDDVAKQLAQVTEERQKKLLDINGISQQDYDIALNNLKSIEADMKVLQVQIGYTNILAPFEGTVGLRNISEGSYVSQNTQLVNLEQLSPIKIDFYVPEKYAGAVQKDETINFTVTGFSNTFQGKIYAIDPKIDEATRSIHVRALADNKDGKLLPGVFAEITIQLNHAATALMVPSEAIIPQVTGQSIYVVKHSIVSSVPVTMGIRTDSTVEIMTGLHENDTIIDRGVQLVHIGSEVKFKSIR